MRPILLKGHERPLTFIKYNREGDLVFTCAKDHHPTLWYSDDGERVGTYIGHNGAVWTADITGAWAIYSQRAGGATARAARGARPPGKIACPRGGERSSLARSPPFFRVRRRVRGAKRSIGSNPPSDRSRLPFVVRQMTPRRS